jgi:peptidoglycan L-alanyl-D-glutamate endopeptidase CwlK
VVPLDAKRKPVWNDDKLWQQIGNIGESVGLAWGGRFKTFPDKPHFQKSGITIQELKQGVNK